MKFYLCNHCKNLVAMVNDSGVNPVCCGEKMTLLVPGTVDASLEKHVPVATVEGDVVTVDVGAVTHPMAEEHYIEWIYLETCCGGQIKYLKAGDAPKASFVLNGQKPVAVYAYCNLHGLWKTEL
ncbi:MAG: desulfoferrodoxin [Ruminococcaceae bacterium]|nr:desulfoferrodoxin [Oscillospiraceae bacterium]